MVLRHFACACFAAMIAWPTFASESGADKAALTKEGAALIKQFAGALTMELQTAIEAEGVPSAITACNISAPEIAEKVSAESAGWKVARASHKLRNPANAPDVYTAAVINEFLAREAAGESATDLAKAEIVEEDGKSIFRLVKAIPTGEMCLACHGGDTVSPEVEAELTRLYPEDRARGFELGQMRGVFTLSKTLD